MGANKGAYYFLIFLAVILVILIILAFVVVKKEKASKISGSVFGNKYDIWYRLYLIFKDRALSRGYLRKIRTRIAVLSGADKRTIGRKTIKIASLALGMSVCLLIISGIVSNFDGFYMLMISLCVVVIHGRVITFFSRRAEEKLLVQFVKFIGDVRHHFHEHGMIDEAIYDSIEQCDYEMSVHAQKIYDMLVVEDNEELINEYNEGLNNKYFALFISLSCLVMRFGDAKNEEGRSVYLDNLNHLKQSLEIELLNRKKLNYIFSSLSLISIAPVFFMRPLRRWAMWNLPELEVYFKGVYGFVTPILVFSLVLLTYALINRLQTASEDRRPKNFLLERLAKQSLVSRLLQRKIDRNYSKANKIYEDLRNVGDEASVKEHYLSKILLMCVAFTVVMWLGTQVVTIKKHMVVNYVDKGKTEGNISGRYLEDYTNVVREYVNENKGRVISREAIKEELYNSEQIYDKDVAELATTTIYDKLSEYDKACFKWYYVLVAIFVAWLAYQLPTILLKFRKKIMQMSLENEVLQFHSVIMMLMYVDRMDVEDILQWMYQFAVVFKPAIGKCLNDYENGDIEALEQLKLDEPFPLFVKLVENLQTASQKITIRQAFDELVTERYYYQEKHKQDSERIIEEKGSIGKLIAFAPAALVLATELLIPFIGESIRQLMNYSEQITKIM